MASKDKILISLEEMVELLKLITKFIAMTKGTNPLAHALLVK
jgi:hypothetical protein